MQDDNVNDTVSDIVSDIMNDIEIRKMEADDFDAIMLLQSLCYFGDIPECRVSLFAKFSASPNSCFVAQIGDRIVAYLFAIPWNMECPPQLNAMTCELPMKPDAMYLHDLAIAPDVRGRKIAHFMFRHLLQQLPYFGLTQLCLVAVQNSSGFWQSLGFKPVQETDFLKEKLGSYGGEAIFMRCSLL